MAIIAVLTFLAIAQAVLGRPIDVDAPCGLLNELSLIVTTQTTRIHSIDAIMPLTGPFEIHSASSAASATTAKAAPLEALGASITTPVVLWVSASVIALAMVVSLVVWGAYKAVLACRRAASLATPSPASPAPPTTSICMIGVTKLPTRFEEDETMRSVSDIMAAAPEEPTGQASQHKCTSTIPVANEEGMPLPEAPTRAIRHQRSVLGTANQIPVIKIIEATPERSEKKAQVYPQRFNSRAITAKQARLQNLI